MLDGIRVEFCENGMIDDEIIRLNMGGNQEDMSNIKGAGINIKGV